MKISIIVAMANNCVIGDNNAMPWHLPADLKRFRQITMGSPIVMGRKTFESIGRPLPGRTNVIVSNNPDYRQEGCLVFNSIDAALKKSCEIADEVFVIGGSSLYEAIFPLADTFYLTQINKAFEGDTLFPEYDREAWTEVERIDISDDSSVDFSYSFLKFENVTQAKA